jgi:DNA-binding PadR family transcriptional regulator
MTDAELAILSLLAEGPSYDNNLNDEIEARGLRKWTAIGQSSMYYVLDKLERQGLVEKVSDEFGHRKFHISAAGTGVLQTAVSDLLGTPHSHDKSFELGLANLHVLKPSQVQLALQSRQQDIAAQIAKLRIEREQTAGNFQIEALFDHNISMMESELNWLETFVPAWLAQIPAVVEVVSEPNIAPRIKQVILPQDPDSVHKEVTRDALPSTQTILPSNRLQNSD